MRTMKDLDSEKSSRGRHGTRGSFKPQLPTRTMSCGFRQDGYFLGVIIRTRLQLKPSHSIPHCPLQLKTASTRGRLREDRSRWRRQRLCGQNCYTQGEWLPCKRSGGTVESTSDDFPAAELMSRAPVLPRIGPIPALPVTHVRTDPKLAQSKGSTDEQRRSGNAQIDWYLDMSK